MSTLYWIVSCGLLLNVLVGLMFVTRRRHGPESLLAALLLGTAGVALVLVLGLVLELDAALDIALVFALLAAVLGVTGSRWSGLGREKEAPR